MIGAKQSVYFLMPKPERRNGLPVTHSDYSAEWQSRYLKQNYISIDPVISQALAQTSPYDWAHANRKNRAVRDFFGESLEFGVGKQGMTYALRGPDQELAFCSVAFDVSDKAWRGERTMIRQHIASFGGMLNDVVLTNLRKPSSTEPPHLTPREHQCIALCCQGLRDAEIGVILGITERVVRSYIDSARQKLGAQSRAHLATLAIGCGLVRVRSGTG